MPREGTRSATGNSKPRVFQTIDTAPAIKRTTAPKTKKSTTTPKPAGVKKAAAPKKNGVGAKAKAAVHKVEAKVGKTEAKTKKTATKA
ncbi:uncharacterized protein B0I36DRAFT_365136 [Microdochium trichocladiopsis]|uniref:Uncharacterized protein n=1 Tax=Microdochium trichocladiopsis TaxID=1682393 RepID=A0A9P9BNR7_9PEZI|nr:uncharacterized protein B0I36DRAFT_365136 [Microdochium trichocladiopsis]KAH7028016.1 hypothetical protein B0I36DRAFT_365136 [Microdochium trichocladiopsis]